MIKKSYIAGLMLSGLLFGTTLCGCKNDTDIPRESVSAMESTAMTEETTVMDIYEVAKTLANTCSFSSELVENKAYLETHMFNFMEQKDCYVGYTAYVPAEITPEEIMVFEVKTDEDVGAVTTKLNAYVAYQREEYGRYLASAVPKLDDPVILVKDKTIIYIISMDNAAAKEATEALLH